MGRAMANESGESDESGESEVVCLPPRVGGSNVFGVNTIKIALFLFVMFIMISSDVFIDRVLSTSDNKYAEGRHCTVQGTIIQGIVLTFGFMLIHILVMGDYI